jgi:MFS family permease
VSYAADVLPGWLLVGIGVGLCLPTLLATATVPLPPEHVSSGSAVVNTSRQMGYVFGVTMLVAILGTITPAAGAAADSFRWSWWAIAAVALLSAFTALGITARPGGITHPAPLKGTRASDRQRA